MGSPKFYHSQQQRQAQTLVLAPQMRQALRILQVAATDLHAEIHDELQKNPTLEEFPDDSTDTISLDAPPLSPLSSDPNESENPRSRSDVNDASQFFAPTEIDFGKSAPPHSTRAETSAAPYSAGTATEDDARRQHFFESLVAPPSLHEHLSAQAALATLSPTQHRALDYLIGTLDERGYLTQSLDESAQHSGLAPDDLAAATAALRSFDPPGIGAHTLADCLLLQLDNADALPLSTQSHSTAQNDASTVETHALARRILSEHFDLLTRRRLSELARTLDASPDALQRAISLIGRLDPAPGRRFSPNSNRIVEPDIEASLDSDGHWHLTLNRRYIPRLRLSNTYRDLIAKGTLAPSERDYLRERMRAGRYLIDAIEQRQHTVEKLTRELLALQRPFFEHGPAHLRPLTMTELATRLGVHETTISRAAAHKFIKTPHGLFPLRYFFASGYEDEHGTSLANTSVKELIADLIAAESPDAPLSDQAIAEKLHTRGLSLARRTVTKYRESLGLLPSHLRKMS